MGIGAVIVGGVALAMLARKGRRHHRQKPEKFNRRQLEIGTRVEMEHTKSKRVARRIAKDHLREIPDYYTRLLKMEKAAGVKG